MPHLLLIAKCFTYDAYLVLGVFLPHFTAFLWCFRQTCLKHLNCLAVNLGTSVACRIIAVETLLLHAGTTSSRFSLMHKSAIAFIFLGQKIAHKGCFQKIRHVNQCIQKANSAHPTLKNILQRNLRRAPWSAECTKWGDLGLRAHMGSQKQNLVQRSSFPSRGQHSGRPSRSGVSLLGPTVNVKATAAIFVLLL